MVCVRSAPAKEPENVEEPVAATEPVAEPKKADSEKPPASAPKAKDSEKPKADAAPKSSTKPKAAQVEREEPAKPLLQPPEESGGSGRVLTILLFVAGLGGAIWLFMSRNNEMP